MPEVIGLGVALLQRDRLDEHVAGVQLALDGAALALADLDLVFGGHDHVEHAVGRIHLVDGGPDGVPHLVLVAAVGVDEVPGPPGGADLLVADLVLLLVLIAARAAAAGGLLADFAGPRLGERLVTCGVGVLEFQVVLTHG